jgi:hypothetical protein
VRFKCLQPIIVVVLFFYLLIKAVFMACDYGPYLYSSAKHLSFGLPPGYSLVTDGEFFKFSREDGKETWCGYHQFYKGKKQQSIVEAWRDYEAELEYVKWTKKVWRPVQ